MSELVRLGDHTTKIGSGQTPRGGHRAYSTSGIPLIRSQNVLMGAFSLEGLSYISRVIDDEMEGSRVVEGVFAVELAQALGRSPKAIVQALTDDGVEPIAGPSLGNCRQVIYERANLADIDWLKSIGTFNSCREAPGSGIHSDREDVDV